MSSLWVIISLIEIKSAMNLCSRDESSQQSLNDTREFIHSMTEMTISEAIITPRFALSCSMGLMRQLGFFFQKDSLIRWRIFEPNKIWKKYIRTSFKAVWFGRSKSYKRKWERNQGMFLFKIWFSIFFLYNINLLKLVNQIFPNSRDYLAVYEDAGLLGPRSLLAHSIFTTDEEYRRMASTGTSGYQIIVDEFLYDILS